MNRIQKSILCLLFISPSIALATAPVTTPKIMLKVVEAEMRNPLGNFMHYKVLGLCFWMHRHWGIPHVMSTLKVNEFLPDAVVTVYSRSGKNPWLYARDIVDKAAHSAENLAIGHTDSFSDSGSGSTANGFEKFKEVDIIGDPALTEFFDHLGFAMIPSEANELEPYYSSMTDGYLWRDPLEDDIRYFYDLLPGRRMVGSFIDTWGKIIPRIGYLNQMGDFKAAGVDALRAADIATQADQMHIYNPLHSGSCGSHCQVWASHEDDEKDVEYQEIYPVSSTKEQHIFGNTSDEAKLSIYRQSQYKKGHGNYVFVMWRHYRGCIRGHGKYIGSF